MTLKLPLRKWTWQSTFVLFTLCFGSFSLTHILFHVGTSMKKEFSVYLITIYCLLSNKLTSYLPSHFIALFYCQLYTELSQCYQSLISSEASLRQRHQELGVQLAERDQHILQLQAQLQQTQQEQKEQPVQETTRCSSRNRQTNLKVSILLLFTVHSQIISAFLFLYL